MKIMIVTDDGHLMRGLDLLLSTIRGNNITATDSGEDAVSILTYEDEPTLVILGPTTADLSATATVRKIREKCSSPIIGLQNAEGDIATRCKMLLDGADDVLMTPWDGHELKARIHAVQRRSMGHAKNIIAVGDITFDMTLRKASVAGRPIRLTNLEMVGLELLMMRKGTTVPKQSFMDAWYAGRDEADVKIVDVIICKLRAKLGAAAKHITTDWGRGYRVEDEPGPPTRTDESTRWRCLKLLATAPNGSHNTRAVIAGLQPSPHYTAKNMLKVLATEGLVESYGVQLNRRHMLTPAGKAALDAYISVTTPANAA